MNNVIKSETTVATERRAKPLPVERGGKDGCRGEKKRREKRGVRAQKGIWSVFWSYSMFFFLLTYVDQQRHNIEFSGLATYNENKPQTCTTHTHTSHTSHIHTTHTYHTHTHTYTHIYTHTYIHINKQ